MASDWLKRTLRRARSGFILLRGLPRRIPWLRRQARVLGFLFDCRLVRRHLSDARDAELPPLPRTLLRAHVAVCPECSPVDTSMRSTIDLLGELRHHDRPERGGSRKRRSC